MSRISTKRGFVLGLAGLAAVMAALTLSPTYTLAQGPVDPAALNAVARTNTSDWGAATSAAFNVYTVPAGKRLVIENVSAHIRVLTGAFVVVRVNTSVGGAFSEAEVPLVFQGTFGREAHFSATQNMRLYADPNTAVTISYFRSTTDTTGKVTLGFSGYLVDKP
jgi:hypothetical protein